MTSARARAIAASFSPSGTTPISRTWAFSEKVMVDRPKRARVVVARVSRCQRRKWSIMTAQPFSGSIRPT